MEDQEAARQVVGWVFILVPIIFVYKFGKWYRELSKVSLSARTQGVITSSNLSSVMTHSAANSVWSPRIKYSYSVDGREYSSSRIGLIHVYWAKFLAKLIYAKYTLGAEVTVHYDAHKPTTCALEPNSWRILVGALVLFALIFPLLGILALSGIIGQ
ncbi:DUF3592 domain-containing protein [Luteolibacter pohnpeiensis]|uniref:DUF3592 domain-containing protein n=1 Tax=Luteolibacter pohnpeiensis TaxID=454153 RepID=A0A934SBL1_9BACT|nr:DUF3592 domain-containing protein [Luteolibacter pohnpeiensis]MBK1884521.1 DUF3592 domain-containing protein [Luteolibacter pohnpeiensis]